MRLIDGLLEAFIDILLVCELHVGPAVDDDRVVAGRIDINVSHSRMMALDDLPSQLDVGCLHLLLQMFLCIIVAHLPQKVTLPCQFPDRDCLVGSLSAIGGEVPVGLDGLANSWDLVDIEEVVGIGTSQHTDFLASLHKIYLNRVDRIVCK